MANKISEQLFEAVDVLINKRILDSSKDKTILCTIEDNSKAADGEYTVSNASARFTAYSENTKYKQGQNVWVLIPDGDYNNDKLIVSKYASDSSEPYVYVDPMDTFIDMTDNILPTDQTISEVGLLANCDYPISVLSVGSGEGDEEEYKTLHDKLNEKRLRLPREYTIDDPQPPVVVLAAAASGDTIPVTQLIYNEKLITPDSNKNHILNGIDIDGYNKIGIQADFKTAFGDNKPISGTYGLCFVIKAKKEIRPEKEYEENVYSILLDSSKMWGNPYEYFDFFTQSLVVEFDQEELGWPISIDCYFYQNFDFIGEDGGPLPYFIATGVDTDGNPTDEYSAEYFDKNIFVKNIRLSFGYSVDEISTETLRLYTNSSKIYESGDSYSKKIKLRYIYVTDNQRQIVINGTPQLIDYAKQLSSLANRYPIIRWYKKNADKDGTALRRGSEWDEVYVTDNLFEYTAKNLKDDVEESYQSILYSNVKAPYYLYNLYNALDEIDDRSELFNFCSLWKQVFDQIYPDLEIESFDDELEEAIRSRAIKILKDEGIEEYTNEQLEAQIEEIKNNPDQYPEMQKHIYIQQAWADSDIKELLSNVLTFNNKDNATDIADAKARSLTLTSGDDSKGVFNCYEATFAADNNLINPADEFIPRKINATFNSNLIDDKGIVSASRLAWYVPKNNTMIHAPSSGRTYNGTRVEDGTVIALPQYCFTTQTEIDAYKSKLSDEEYALYSQRIKTYYIVLEDWTEQDHARPTENLVSLIYYIKPKLIKQWTNNTILASMYRNGQIYEGDNAKITLTFSVKGANGTNHTLVVQMMDEFIGVLGGNENEWTLKSSPSAWTYNYDTSSDQNTCALRIAAALYDKNDKEIQNASIKWEVLYPNVMFNTPTIRTKTINGIYGTWLQPSPVYPSWVNRDKCRGAILKCTAEISLTEKFDGYLIIPMRNSRDIEVLQGATMIRYDSAGVNPQYYTGAYGFVDINGNIDYTNIKAEMKIPANSEPSLSNPVSQVNRIRQYFPEIIAKSGTYYLKAQSMYFNGVDYDCQVKVTKKIDEDETLEWTQPILVLVDPYGNSFLNSWNGDLVVDKTNNRIMASVLGAGKKENDNTFTGLLLGNLPEVENVGKTGLLGYEHGEQSYGIFDDGSAFLGKSSVAQIRFDGSTGVLGNSGYLNQDVYADKVGTILSLAGDQNSADKPYFDMKAEDGAGVYFGTGGGKDTPTAYLEDAPVKNLYFRITAPKGENDTGALGKELIHIGKSEYYLQTPNYSNTGTKAGFKIDLKNHAITSYDDLTILGSSNSTINFGNGRLVLNGSDGSINLSKLNFVDSNGNLRTVSGATGPASNIEPQWMTFVTSISGSITRDYAPVTVSGSVPYTYTYSTYTTTSLTGNLSFSGTGSLRDANLAAGNVGNTISHTNNAQVSIGGISGFNYDDYNWAFYLPVTVTGALNTTGTKTTTVDVDYRGSTDVPVVTNIKLTIQKVSMWALTNSSTKTSTITIS